MKPLLAVRRVLRWGLELAVLGWGAAWGAEPASSGPVKIGLFIPTRGEQAAQGRAVQRGAEMAAAEINAEGGLEGRPLRLAIGSADERWEASTAELVRLIYEEEVWAVLGAVDGKSAHLAEQVVARARGRVVFATPWATDPTLTQIKIPWFFRTVPDDRQQAKALAREIFEVRRLGRVAAIAEDRYDARMAATAFAKAAEGRAAVFFQDGGEEEGWAPLAEGLRQSRAEGWVLFGRPAVAARWVSHLRQEGMEGPLFGPLALACAEFLQPAGGAAEGAVLVAPEVQGPEGRGFRREFEETYGDWPPPLAFYAYDGLMALAEAIRQAGLNRENIPEALARLKIEGITGPVEFDSSGNRQGRVEVGWVRKGRLLIPSVSP